MRGRLISRIEQLEAADEKTNPKPIWYQVPEWIVDAAINRGWRIPVKDEQGRHWIDLNPRRAHE